MFFAGARRHSDACLAENCAFMFFKHLIFTLRPDRKLPVGAMKTLWGAVATGLLLGFSACQHTPGPSQHEKIAQVYCECTAALGPLNQQAASQVADTTGQTSFYTLLKQIQDEHTKARECLTSVTAQYGKLSPEMFAEIEKIIAQKCPAMSSNPELLRELLGE